MCVFDSAFDSAGALAAHGSRYLSIRGPAARYDHRRHRRLCPERALRLAARAVCTDGVAGHGHSLPRQSRLPAPTGALPSPLSYSLSTLREPRACSLWQRDAFNSSFGYEAPPTAAMLCRADGQHSLPGQGVTIQGEFNRSTALSVTRSTCQTFEFGRAKAGKQARQRHAGPALIGADADLGHVLHRGPAGRFSLMNMGMNYSAWAHNTHGRRHDGLWTPCTNVAFIMCALRGWLPGQESRRTFHIATPGRELMSRCRPCGECLPGLHWDECFIVRAEYCMVDSFCSNGAEIWGSTGNWTCVPRSKQRKVGDRDAVGGK